MMRLHCTTASPFSRKVLVLAHEAGLMDRLELILANVGTHVPLDSMAHTRLACLNGLMKIPVLETDDGEVLFDSRVICEYLASLCLTQAFYPSAGRARWRALRNQALADGLLDAALLCRFEAARAATEQSQDWLRSQQRRMRQALAQLEHIWQEAETDALTTVAHPFDGAGHGMDGADIGQISVGCALGYLDFRFDELAWRQGCPALSAWFRTFSERESMRLTFPQVAPSA